MRETGRRSGISAIDRGFGRIPGGSCLIARLADLTALLRETEALMLHEMQDWLMLMRFVSLETV